VTRPYSDVVGSRWRLLPAGIRDLLSAVGAAIVWFGGFFLLSGRHHDWSGYDRTWVCAGVATTLAVALTRRFPKSCLLGVLILYPLAYSSSGTNLSSEFHVLPVLVVGFIVTATAGVATRWALGACLLSVTILSGALPAIAALAAKVVRGDDLAIIAPSGATSLVQDPVRTAFCAGATVAVILLGASMSRARRTAELLAVRNEELMELRELESRQVVAAERTRIARELHDVVAHHMSAIVIRAQAAERVAAQKPEAPLEATRWIASTGQDALTAMRQIVRVLRKDESTATRVPEEGLAALAGIAERVTEAGLAVRLQVDDQVPPLAAHVQLAAVRIVQEALTNVLIHAGATSADVQLASVNGGLLVCVDDDGTVGTPPRADLVPIRRTNGTGNGLVGMRERAQSCGGWLTLSSGPRGGWCVTALLPLGAV
jgi:signal transduction histidine kinase